LLWLFFEIESRFLPRPAWTMILLFKLLIVTGMTGVCHHNQLLVEMGVLWTFYLGWSWTVILPISVSWVAGTMGAQPDFVYFYWSVAMTRISKKPGPHL
jgi:hypothetical protein